MSVYTLDELVTAARSSSPYYRHLYRNAPSSGWRLSDLPPVDQAAFWEANTFRDNKVLTGPITDGIVFKSGGTTGAPKFSVYTRAEWETFTYIFGHGMAAGGLEHGDRIGNLFYAGELYASFLFITASAERAPVDVVVFPIGGGTPHEMMIAFIQEYGINILAGVTTSILALAESIGKAGLTDMPVTKILFGGESMYDDQREHVAAVFNGAKVHSIGYASVDAGLLGYADPSCGQDEHRVFGDATVIELLDEESGDVIDEPGRPGALHVTNLTRKLMPFIRYPAGDRAVWIDDSGIKDRRFLLLGRSKESARIGPMTLYVDNIREFLHEFKNELDIINFQMVIDHLDERDLLTLNLVATRPPEDINDATARIVSALYGARPMFRELVEQKYVHPPAVLFVDETALEKNLKTGKLRAIVDRRFADDG